MKNGFVIAAVGLLLAVACGGTAGSTADSVSRGGAGGSSVQKAPALPQDAAGQPGKASSGGTGALPDASTGPSNLTAPQPNEGPRVIRTGRVVLEVPNGSFNDKLDQLGAVIAADKGYISGTDTQAPERGGLRIATITYQIPSANFDDALTQIRRLGTMQNLSLSGQDVSSQYVDLQARLKVQQEQRDFYLALLAQAKTTQDLITIRNQLAPILDQIERLQGQIDYYDHATTYATLTVTLHEAAAGLQPTTDFWGFRTSLTEAARLFVSTVNLVVLGLGATGPFLLLLIPAFLFWRRRQRRTAGAM